MSRFRSRLFTWIERSLPVQLGRKARQIFDKIAAELVEKLAQTIDKLEQQTNAPTLPRAVKKLLQPAKALVKFMAKHWVIPAPKTEPMVQHPSTTAIRYTPKLPEGEAREHHRKQLGELNELIVRAIAYFQKKKRTLPAPALPSAEVDRMMRYSAMGAEETVPWLDDPQPPSKPISTAVLEKQVEPWEAELDDHCMRAWIETQATFLGYADSPIIKFLLWLDGIILKIEQCLIAIWQKLVSWWQSKFSKV